jgi:ribosomal protein S18 acetylase RimI-like enzyme
MTLCVEDARKELLPVLAEMRSEFWRDQTTKGLREPMPGCGVEDVARLLGRPRSHLLIALKDDQPVGYLFGQTKILPGAVAQKVSSVEEVLTLPAVRREGVARRLFETALTRFRDDESNRVQLRVLANNFEAQAFWRSVGFSAYLTTLELETVA